MCISNIGPSGERSRSRPECASLLLFMLLLLLCTTPLETHPRERILSLMLHHQPCCFPNIAFFRFVCSVPFLPSFVPSFLSFFLSFLAQGRGSLRVLSPKVFGFGNLTSRSSATFTRSYRLHASVTSTACLYSSILSSPNSDSSRKPNLM